MEDRMRTIACFCGMLLAAALPLSTHAAAQQSRELDAGRAEAQYNSGKTFVRNPQVDELLTTILKRLADANPEAASRAIRVHALSSPTPYIFTLENGAMYVSTGLIGRLRNHSQLAALMAADIAALVRDDKATGEEAKKRRTLRRLLPDLLLITATAGLAAPAMANRDAAKDRSSEAELQRASDQAALLWLKRAAFDVAQAPEGLRVLKQALLAEQRLGPSMLANEKDLDARIQSFEQPVPSSVDVVTAAQTNGAEEYWPVARRLLEEMINADLESTSVTSIGAILDAIEKQDGPGLHSACMRAEFMRKTNSDRSRLPEVILAYEKCVAFEGVNPTWFRELGHLQRRNGDSDAARRSFETYLQRAPEAVDAPIIKTYVQAP